LSRIEGIVAKNQKKGLTIGYGLLSSILQKVTILGKDTEKSRTIACGGATYSPGDSNEHLEKKKNYRYVFLNNFFISI
jgi:hypothetical protein